MWVGSSTGSPWRNKVSVISDLPTQLVAAFRATLEEVLGADVILHVRDISADETEEQARDVEAILDELGVNHDLPRIEVWNKTDRLDDEARAARETEAARNPDVIATSALTGAGVDGLTAAIEAHLARDSTRETLRIGFEHGRDRAWLHEAHVVVSEGQDEDGWQVEVDWTGRQKAEFAKRAG